MDNEFDPLELDDYSDESPENIENPMLDFGLDEDSTARFEDDDDDYESDAVPVDEIYETPTVIAANTSEEKGVSDIEIDDVKPTREYIPNNRPGKVYGGMWGRNEIITVGIGALAILGMLAFVFFMVFPAQKELAQNKKHQDELEAELVSAKGKYGSITDTETQVAKLVSSVNDFETRFLPSEANGKSALYERLNGLITAYGLVNSNGPEFTPLEILDPQRRQQQENERGRDKLMSLFPGVFVTVTVEGPYQNLRRFIREIETSQQFIMVSSVELVPADKQKEKNAEQQAQQISESGPNLVENSKELENIYRGKTRGETVSLKIEMAAYFRRPNYTPFTTEVSAR
jgi:hypothetical protein